MTWTLRFYDGDGVEIGYVEKPDRDTYNWSITHPDSGWEQFEYTLRSFTTLEDQGDYSDMESPLWQADHGPRAYKAEPETHLRMVQDRLSYDGVADSVLRDE